MDIQGQTIEALTLDPSTNLANSGKSLIFMRGASAGLAAIANGTGRPLGISRYTPSKAADVVYVDRFGCTVGVQLAVASGPVALDHLIYSTANGQAGDLTGAHGTLWVIGLSSQAATAAGQQFTFVPCFPYQVTQ